MTSQVMQAWRGLEGAALMVVAYLQHSGTKFNSYKTVKLWDLAGNQPTCIASTNPKVGAILSANFCKDAPFLLALGRSKGTLHVWDTMTCGEVSRRFGRFSSRPPRQSTNKVDEE
jgi:WD40 repeat protein